VIVKLAIDKSGVRRRLASGGGELGRRRVCRFVHGMKKR